MVCRGSTLLFRATGHGRHATGRWSIARKPTGLQPGLLVPAAPGSGLATQVRAYGRSPATVQPPRFAAQSPARNEAVPPPLKAHVALPADAVPRANCQMRDQAPRDRRAGWAETPPGLAGPRQLPPPSHAHRARDHLLIKSDCCGPHATRLGCRVPTRAAIHAPTAAGILSLAPWRAGSTEARSACSAIPAWAMPVRG